MLNEFEYFKPESIEEVLNLLEKKENKTALLAGGTDLFVDMKHKMKKPNYIIDLKNIEQLTKIEEVDQGLFIGGTVTCNELIKSDLVKKKYKVLADSAMEVAAHQIRNRATIIGNLCTASPGADMFPSLLVLKTKVIAVSKEGKRAIPLEEFATGVKRNSLKDNEVVTGIVIQKHSADGKGTYLKKRRTKGPDLSAVGVAGYLSKDEEYFAFGLGAVAPTPIYLDASKIFFGNGSFEAKQKKLLKEVTNKINPIDDVRSTKKYRIKMAQVYTRRILSRLWEAGDK